MQRKAGSADRGQLADPNAIPDHVVGFFRRVGESFGSWAQPRAARELRGPGRLLKEDEVVIWSCWSVLRSGPNWLAEDVSVMKNSTVRDRARTSCRRGGASLRGFGGAVEDDDGCRCAPRWRPRWSEHVSLHKHVEERLFGSEGIVWKMRSRPGLTTERSTRVESVVGRHVLNKKGVFNPFNRTFFFHFPISFHKNQITSWV